MAITVSLDKLELTDTVSDLVTSVNGNVDAITAGFASVPAYSQVSRNSSAGLCPGLPSGSGTTKYLREDGTWQVPPDTNTTYSQISRGSSAGLAPGLPSGTGTTKYLREDGSWQVPPDNNTTYSAGAGLSLSTNSFSLSTSGATAGSYGMSAATTGNNNTTVNIPYITVDKYGRVTAISNKVLTCVNTNTTYSQVSRNSGAGLCPGLPSGSGTTKYLREDGTWQTPPNTNTTYTAGNGLTLTGTEFKMSGSYTGNFTATKVYNAVWNDYAECREAETVEPGRCVTECEDGIMRKTTKRLQAGCKLTSDTFGACMGETDKAKTPIAVAGRVLVYPYKGKQFKLGDAVCSAPDGTVDVMSRREIRKYPDRIVGIVSEIPKYEEWMAGTKENPQKIKVDGRIWVYVR